MQINLLRVNIPLKIKAFTRSGLLIAYVNDRVDPQLPPNTIQRSIPRCSLNFSRSFISCQVVFSCET